MVLFVYILKPFLINAYRIPGFFVMVLASVTLYFSLAYLLEKIIDDGSLMRLRKIIRHLAPRRAT